MNKLFYESKKDFKPVLYMVMGEYINGKDDWTPMTFCATSGRFCFGELNDSPSTTCDPAEIYDYETVMLLMGHHAQNSECGTQLRLVPVFLLERLNGPSESPYLNPDAPLDGIIDEIIASAQYAAEQNPNEEPEPWHLPKSLGGAEVVSVHQGANPIPVPFLSEEEMAWLNDYESKQNVKLTPADITSCVNRFRKQG